MTRVLFTSGYEGLSIATFIARLDANGIRTVLDVRKLPLSRKRGFSKCAFARALHEKGIGYVHLPALGCPKPIRDRYKTDGDWTVYTKAFHAYLVRQRTAIAELVQIAGKSNCCLVCFEADFNRCHRTYVGRAAVQISGLRLMHLTEGKAVADAKVQIAA